MGGGSSKSDASSSQVASAPIKVDANAMALFKQQMQQKQNISPQIANPQVPGGQQQQQQMTQQNSQPNLQSVPNENNYSALASMKDRTLQILYGRFVYLYLSSLPDQNQRSQVMKSLQTKGLSDPNVQISLLQISKLQEFQFNPFLDRIIVLLTLQNGGANVNFEGFCNAMSVFCYDTLPEIKRKFLFRIYDKEGKNEIPMIQIRGILTEELFVRSHYSEVQPGVQVKSSYSDRIMRDIMDDVMQKFDQDANKTIDYNEFKEIISDADVDLMFSLY